MPDFEKPESLLSLVDRLTKETVTWVDRDAGKQMTKRQGLLLQLRTAVFAGMENGGSGSAFGSKPPIDTSAADLLEQITTQAAEALASVSSTPTPYGQAESYVRLWAAATTETKMVIVSVRRERPLSDAEEKALVPRVYRELIEMNARRLAQSWVDRIEDFFNPPSTREIRAQCPSCDQRYAYRQKDGQVVRSAALNFIRDRKSGRTVEARCSVCACSWSPPQFEYLAKLIDARPLPELSDTPSGKITTTV